MKTLPSKELMGKVLLDIEKEEICTYELCWGRDIKYSIIFKDSNNDGTFYYEDDKINIYELAQKCKEWAYNLKQEIIIKSYTVFNAGGCELIDKMGCSVYICDAKTEPEAIFKACEYIMEQTK